MRVLVTGQPASGLFILGELLYRLYGLENLNVSLDSLPEDSSALAQFIQEGGFSDGSLMAWHYSADPALLEACRQQGVQVVCTVRDPYILFETVYLHANSPRGMPAVPETTRLKGEDMESAVVLDFIHNVFSRQLRLTADWQASGQALMVHQEQFMLEVERTLEVLEPVLGKAPDKDVPALMNAILEKHALGSALNPLSDSRLPAGTLQVLNEVIPQAFFELGYQKRGADAQGSMNQRMLGMALFQQLYAGGQRVFLVGHGKSGTTWLHMLFFHHPNVAAVAERRLFEHPDQNKALFDALLDDETFESWFQSSSFGIKAPEQTDVRYELMRLMSDYLLYRALAVRKTAKGFERREPITHFSEKIALNTDQDARVTIDTLQKLYPDAKIVHIVRDPRDVAVSAMFHSYRNFREKHERNWITDFVDSVLEGDNSSILKKQAVSAYFKSHARAWNKIAGIFHHRGETLYGDNYLLVRYEDLLAAPQDQVTRLFRFAGLSRDEQLVADVVEKASFKNLSKGRKAGQQDSSSFYRKGVAGDWKNYLTPETSRKVFSDAWELMQLFGYE